MKKTAAFIAINQLCSHYQVEMSFFIDLSENGLIEIKTIKKTLCIHQDKISDIERIIRLHHELGVNFEGIDVIFNLLQKLDDKEHELIYLKNRLRIYEN